MKHFPYIGLTIILGYCLVLPLFGQVDTTIFTYQDSLKARNWQTYLNETPNPEKAKDSVALKTADSLLQWGIQQKDTSAMISAYAAKINWIRNQEGDEDAPETLWDSFKMTISSRGYIVDTNLTRIDDVYYYNVIYNSFLVYPDSNGTLDFDSIRASGFQTYFVPNDNRGRELDSTTTYWIKLRLRGNGVKHQEMLLLPNHKDQLWQKVIFYKPNIQGKWDAYAGGATVPLAKRMTSDWRDLYKVGVRSNDDFYVYFKLKGFKEVNRPYGISIRHINGDFLTVDKVKTNTRVFIFIGILIFQLFFFLFWYFATKEKAFVPYLSYIFSIAAIAYLSIQFKYWVPNPDFERDAAVTSLQLSFAWLAGVSVMIFTQRYLNSRSNIPRLHRFIQFFKLGFSVIAIPILALPITILFFGDISGNLASELYAILVKVFIFFIVLGLVLISYSGWQAWQKGFKPARFYLIAVSMLLLGVGVPALIPVFDLYSISSFNGAMTSIQAGILLQLCFFALGLGNKRSILEKEKTEAQNQLLAEQQKVNTAFGRFVPHKFLQAIGRDSVLDVKLGDGVEQEVTVFFSDIRGYTRLAESMQPKENFSFLNGYLGRLGPIISEHNGFVNQYYGDGIMAIFMQNPENALQASIAIQQKLQSYNEERKNKGRVPIQIGIGLHTGPLIMGIIGDTLRMEAGVVSDTVNTAARMEGLTKYYGSSILVSETVFEGIEQKEHYTYRYLGKVQVKGRQEPLKVYDFYDGDMPDLQAQKHNSLQNFETGVTAYYERDFAKAAKAFDQVILQFPSDRSSLNYLEKAKQHLLHGISDDWTGVEEMTKK